MKNLFLGYFHTPRNKRAEVLRLMGNVVGLERDDVDKVSGHTVFFSLSSTSSAFLLSGRCVNLLVIFISHKVCFWTARLYPAGAVSATVLLNSPFRLVGRCWVAMATADSHRVA